MDLVNLCFNYFASDHVAAACHNPERCFRCKDIGHTSVHCKRPCSPPLTAPATDQAPPRRLAPPCKPTLLGPMPANLQPSQWRQGSREQDDSFGRRGLVPGGSPAGRTASGLGVHPNAAPARFLFLSCMAMSTTSSPWVIRFTGQAGGLRCRHDADHEGHGTMSGASNHHLHGQD